jgi:hypothetical protein
VQTCQNGTFSQGNGEWRGGGGYRRRNTRQGDTEIDIHTKKFRHGDKGIVIQTGGTEIDIQTGGYRDKNSDRRIQN